MRPDRPSGGAAALSVAAFRRLAASYTLNELSWGFGTVALAVLVYDRTHAALAPTALFLATSFLPAFLSPALTARIDRYAVGRALPALYAVEAALFGALAALTAGFWLPLVLALAFADGVLAMTGRALTRAAVAASLRPVGALEEGNRLLNVSLSIAFAAGPALGGLIVASAGIAASLLVAAGLFAVMAVLLATSRALPASRADGATPWPARFRAGLAYVGRQPTVRRVLSVHAGALVCAAALAPIEVVYARRTLGGGDGTYGLILAAWGAGTILSSFALARVRASLPAIALIPAAAATMGAGQLVMALAPSIAVAVMGCLIAGAGNGFYYVSVVQAIQERVDDAYQARVMGLLEATTAACFGAGYLAGGALVLLLAPRGAIAASAAGVLIAAAATVVVLRADGAGAVTASRGSTTRRRSAPGGHVARRAPTRARAGRGDG